MIFVLFIETTCYISFMHISAYLTLNLARAHMILCMCNFSQERIRSASSLEPDLNSFEFWINNDNNPNIF